MGKRRLLKPEQMVRLHLNQPVLAYLLDGPEQILLKGILREGPRIEGERIHRYSSEKGTFELKLEQVLMIRRDDAVDLEAHSGGHERGRGRGQRPRE